MFDTAGPTPVPNAAQPYMLDNRRFAPDQPTIAPPATSLRGNANTVGVFYDMDSGDTRVDKRQDPITAILNRLDSISADLSTTVKSADIVDMARKGDIKVIQDRLDNQEAEILGIKSQMKTQQERLAAMSLLIDQNTATSLDLGQQSAELRSKIVDQQTRPSRSQANDQGNVKSPKRMNIIIEGIPVEEDDVAYVITLAGDLGMILFRRDIVMTERLKRRNENDNRPAPLLVGFANARVHDDFLRKKRVLKGSERYDGIWINPDETLEVRKLKSIFRKIAYRVRQDGKEAYFNHESIKIGDDVYYKNDLYRVPPKYQPDAPVHQNDRPFQFIMDAKSKDAQDTTKTAADMLKDRLARKETTGEALLPQREGPALTATNLEAPTATPKSKLYPPSDPKVKIRLTNSELLFSGPTAFVSNHYERYFVFEGLDHRTLDHGYFFKKAMTYKRPDLADKIRAVTSPLDAKDCVRDLGLNPEWERIKAPTLKEMFDAKMSQHQDLMDGLLDTAPHRLIEASWDGLWGGGAPFDSKKYDEGTFDGFNQFGDMATDYRDCKLKILRPQQPTDS